MAVACAGVASQHQACDQLRLTDERGIQHFQRDPATQVAIVPRVNHTHCATANLLFENMT